MKLLLSRHADWLLKDLEEMTPLHLATRHSSSKPLSLLLKHMAPGEVDTQDKNKQTALHWSAFYNHPEHVKLLIKHDSNIGIPDIEGKIPLHWAAHNKHPSATHTVRCILEAAPTESLLNWQDYEGRTPLHFAVADGNESVVEVLTSYEGCSVTAYDNLFRTPLHWAALLGHARIVHLLLERNKSGTIPSDSQGATPLHYGAQSNYADTVAVFLRHPSVRDEPDLEGRTAFMWAAGKGSDDVIRTMLDLKKDLDINMADKYGGTALHAAALSGHVSTVRLLLERGAMVDPLDVMKHTPLFRACEMGHRDVILTLIKGEARVDLVDIDGHSALHWAALGGNAEVCQILMENGISPNLQDHAGRTPLQCAAYAGYINCMALLIQHNADPNLQDKEGRTALHWSCNNGYLDAVKLLLSCGAFPNHMEHTEERYTPLDYALLGEHHEVTQFLLEHGALSIAAIQDIAASSIQALYKGYKVRRAFRERKNLLMKHEQLRKDAAKKREEERRREAEQQLSLAGAEQQQRLSLATAEDQRPSLAGASMGVKNPAVSQVLKTKKSPKTQQNKPDKLRHKERRRKEVDTTVTSALPASSPGSEQESRTVVNLDCVTGVCSSDTCASTVCVSKRERRSPAGSSRPGSAKPTHAGVHQAPGTTETSRSSRPRTAGIHQERGLDEASAVDHPRPSVAVETQTKPESAGDSGPCSEVDVTQDADDHGVTNAVSLIQQRPEEKERRTERDMEKPTEREKEKQREEKDDRQTESRERESDRDKAAKRSEKEHGRRTERKKERLAERERDRRAEREREHGKKSIRKKNHAASTIQRAWRRSRLRRRLREALRASEKGAGPAEVTALLLQLIWDWPINIDHATLTTGAEQRVPAAKTTGKKSTVLQNIYGGSQARMGRGLRGAVTLNSRSQSQLLLDLSLKNNKHLSGVECVHLLDSLGQAKHYSYHMRPQSASNYSTHNRTKN
ncbi:inversin [Chanos chanos]|uniref:Inversin n=1 Tax=Chanos chanos TaxID=29144 RepID=A0A6J2WD12_CHACN|nr:inversin [Chanos chanos]